MYKGHWTHSLLYFEFVELTLITIQGVTQTRQRKQVCIFFE